MDRALPGWSGCRSLEHDELLLIGDHAASFDSRYFGPVRTSSVEGRAVALHIP
jgi:type IV secretory pathway protease TraF